MCVCSGMSGSVTPWAVAHQAPLSKRFSSQEYCGGLLFPSPGDLPDPGIKPASAVSPASAGRFFTTEPPGKATCCYWSLTISFIQKLLDLGKTLSTLGLSQKECLLVG